MIKQENITYKWQEIKGGVRNLWGYLSLEEIEAAKSNLYQLSSSVQEKHHETHKTFATKLKSLLDSFDNDTDKGLLKSVSSFQRAPTTNDNTERSAYH